MSDPFASISVGDYERATDAVTDLFDKCFEARRAFLPREIVACVLDSIRESALTRDTLAPLWPGKGPSLT